MVLTIHHRLLLLIAFCFSPTRSFISMTPFKPERALVPGSPSSVQDVVLTSDVVLSAAASKLSALETAPTRKLLVFDKDGTLGDCAATLRFWVQHMTNRILQVTSHNESVLPEFYSLIGWDVNANDVVPSALVAAGTWDEILLATFEFCSLRATQDVTLETVHAWQAELRDIHGQDPPLLEDLPGLIEACRGFGFEIAICTSDDRPSTNAALRQWQIDHLIDYSICGNEVSQGKPSAAPLMALCQQANVKPSDCIVVGDTTADTGMARQAEAALCVGVLTGSGTSEQLLASGAHRILPNVGNLPALLQEISDLPSEDWAL